MSEHHRPLEYLARLQAPRRTTRQSFALAAVFAFESLACGVILMSAYYALGRPGASWAVISAILVLQPGLEQSFNTALTRVAANLIGAVGGLAIGYFWGAGSTQVLVAVALVIFICEPLRLDLGLRSACVSAIIVMSTGDQPILSAGVNRVIAVLAGCSLALPIQLVTEKILSHLGWLPALPPAPAPVPLQPKVTTSTTTD